MSEAYYQLLEATIQHLEGLKNRGIRFIAVSPQALTGLKATPSSQRALATQSARPQRPAPAAVTPPPRAEQPPAPPVAAKTTSLPLEAPSVAPPSADAPTLTPEAKAAAFAELRQRVIPCVKCAHLAAVRKNVVFGVGDINAQIMFVGEAPGADEDAQGEPFVGRAGQLLTRIIVSMGLSRETVYIANILKCRPDMPPGSSGNRKPTPEEMQTCIPFLHEQIDLIRPKVLIALGATAVEGLLGKTIGITRLRGQWRSYRGIPLMPTFHPSFLLRPDGAREKRKVWEDMMQVMEKIGMPISERQRNFFLSKG